MTPEEVKRRAEAVYRWMQQHHADPNPPCPTCSGVKWEFRLDPPGPYVPRVCMACGHVQWFDAKLLGVAGVELPQVGDGRESPPGGGRAGP